MRRWLAILLLVVLPHQFAWAALGSYCQHESGASAQHFGHHAHQHHAGAQPADGDQDAPHGAAKAVAGAHADCAGCHAGGVSLPVSAANLSAGPAPRADAADLPQHLPPPPVERVERPQWAALA